MSDLVPAGPASLEALRELGTEAEAYLKAARAENTLRAYRADWQHFTTWCTARLLPPLPAAAETLILYLTELSRTHKVATLERRLSAISRAHQAAAHPSPTRELLVRDLLAGVRRRKGVAQRGKEALSVEDLRAMLEQLPEGLLGTRDRALLLLGFAGAFRRGELVGLDVEDLHFTRAGLVVTLRRSKTDQEGEGARKGIPPGRHAETCPVGAVEAWLAAAELEAGPVFRPVDRHGRLGAERLSDRAVCRVVKRAAEAAGLDPRGLGGHSLRAGLATAAAAAGVEEAAIMRQTLHRSQTMVRRYIRDGELFRGNAAGQVGL